MQRSLRESGHRPALGRVGHCHHVVRDALCFLRRGSSGADGHAPVDLHGVHGHHLAAEALCQGHAHFGFAGGGGADDADNTVVHGEAPFVENGGGVRIAAPVTSVTSSQ